MVPVMVPVMAWALLLGRSMRSLGERLSRLLLGTAHPGASLVTEAPAVPVREIFRRFWPYARSYRWWLLATLVFIVAGPLIDAATIWLFKLLVDTVLVPHDLGPLRQIIVAYFGLTLAGGVLSFCDDYLSTWVGERVLLSLRTDFFAHLQTLSLDFFERRPLGDILSRLTSDIASIEEFLLSGMASTISYALRIIFFAGALFYLQWQLALVSLVVVPLFWLTARAFSGRLRQVARAQRLRSGSISAVAEESLGNVMLVQAYNRQADEVARFHHHNLARFAAQLAATRIKALFGPLIDFIELAGMMVILGAGTWLLAQGTISLGGLLVFLAYLSRLYGPIRGVSRFANSLSAASASAERIIE